MKRILATSAIALTVLTGTASAMNIPPIYVKTIQRYVPNADLSGYSTGDIALILSEINKDRDDTFIHKRTKVRALLRALR